MQLEGDRQEELARCFAVNMWRELCPRSGDMET